MAIAAKTGVLGLLKSFDGAEVGSLDSGLVAVDVVESIVRIGECGGDPAIVVNACGRADSVTALVGADVEIQGRGLDTAGAEKTPIVAGDKFDQHQLDSIRGLIAFDGSLAKLFVGNFVFVRKNGDFRRHAVLQGVELRFCFPLFGFRAGGLLRVPAVCFDLLLRSHPDSRVLTGFGQAAGVKL